MPGIEEFPTPPIEEYEGDYHVDYVLIMNRLWPDITEENDHDFVGLFNCPAGGPTYGPEATDTGTYSLLLHGASKWCPPLTLLDRLSVKFPELTFYLTGASGAGDHEEWTAKNGELAVVEMYSVYGFSGVSIVYVRKGVELDLPDFEAQKVTTMTRTTI